MKELDTTGEFWLPSYPNQKLWGTTKFAPGSGVVLRLMGNLPDPFNSRQFDTPLLHGKLVNGAPCTIIDGFCHIEVFSSSSGDHFVSEVSAKQMILGLETTAEQKFTRMAVQFSHLDDWFENPITIEYPARSFEEAEVKWSPDSLDVVVDIGGVPTRIYSFCSRSIPFAATREGATWTYSYIINIEPTGAQPIEWFTKVASSVRRFFVFMIGTGVYTLDCHLFAPSGDRDQRLPVFLPVRIPAVIRPDPRYFSTLHQKVRQAAPTILRSWFEREAQLLTVVNSYDEAMLIDGASPASLFLQTVQTLEHFHGILWTEEARYVPKPTWRRFLKWLRESFPKKLPDVSEEDMARLLSSEDILTSRISWLNNFSFRTRMEQLFTSMPERELMPIVGNPVDLNSHLKQFIIRLEATRHYLTHFSEEQRSLAFTREEMEDVILQCWAVLTFWLAQTLGVDEETAGDMASQAKKAMFLVDFGQRL